MFSRQSSSRQSSSRQSSSRQSSSETENGYKVACRFRGGSTWSDRQISWSQIIRNSSLKTTKMRFNLIVNPASFHCRSLGFRLFRKHLTRSFNLLGERQTESYAPLASLDPPGGRVKSLSLWESRPERLERGLSRWWFSACRSRYGCASLFSCKSRWTFFLKGR